MPEIKPFRAVLYDQKKVNISEVVAPPYDVISPEEQERLYARGPYNVVRLILGREKDPYNAAARSLDEWGKAGILRRETEPALYVLVQSFSTPEGIRAERRGFVAACRLEELGRGTILPHERTLSGPKEDRLRLLSATGAMFSQIFSLYPDPNHRLDPLLDAQTQRPPDVDVEFDQVRNRLWAVGDPGVTLALADFLKRQRVLVADGHHRYETALLYSDALRFKNPDHTGKEPYNFVPMYFTNMNDPGLVILPTHRIIRGIAGLRQQSLLEALKTCFDVEEKDSLQDLARSLAVHTGRAFGLLLPGDPRFTLLSYNSSRTPGGADMPPPLARLDVTILHTVVMKEILRLSEDDQQRKGHIGYEKDIERAARAVDGGNAQAAFLLNPTRVEQLRAIAEVGYTMPQKSTYFFPKLLSGLMMYSFRED